MAARWTKEEEAKLVDLFKTGQGWDAIGFELGRRGTAVQDKASRMGLGFKPRMTNRSPIWPAMVKICGDGQARTVHEFAALTRASRVTIDHLMKVHSDAGDAHVAGWIPQSNGLAAPKWLPRPGKSVPRPRRTAAERQLTRMQRMKMEDPLRYQALLARTTLRRQLKKGVLAQQHQVVQALFGMGAQS